jgi:hypothetical protein
MSPLEAEAVYTIQRLSQAATVNFALEPPAIRGTYSGDVTMRSRSANAGRVPFDHSCAMG